MSWGFAVFAALQAGMLAVQSAGPVCAMTQINFCKFHGFGNDYIVIEKTDDMTDLQGLAPEYLPSAHGCGCGRDRCFGKARWRRG